MPLPPVLPWARGKAKAKHSNLTATNKNKQDTGSKGPGLSEWSSLEGTNFTMNMSQTCVFVGSENGAETQKFSIKGHEQQKNDDRVRIGQDTRTRKKCAKTSDAKRGIVVSGMQPNDDVAENEGKCCVKKT